MTHNSKNIESFNNNLKEVFAKMSINTKYKIVGSSNILPNIFSTDYDLNNFYEKPKSGEDISFQEKETIYENLFLFFQHLFKACKRDKNLFIIDFKCGKKALPFSLRASPGGDRTPRLGEEPQEDNVAIRWEYKDLMKGEKDGVNFIDALKQKSRIKLDIVYHLNGEFIEVSEIYYIAVGDIKNYNDVDFESKNIILELKKDIDLYKKEHNFMKVLKRKYSLFKQEKTKEALQEKLLGFFNSSVGILYKSVSDLKTIILLKEQTFRHVKDDDLFQFQQIIKQRLSIINIPSIFISLDRRKLSVRSINAIIKKLTEIVNTSCNKLALDAGISLRER